MEDKSRVSRSLKNAKVTLSFYLINLCLNFFSRKIFLECLGAEVLGLNTTVQNLLGFLNIAELGISAAISFTLYKPLLDKDHKTINDIVSIQGWLYRKVAYIVIVGASILLFFFTWIFEKTDLPLWYAYSTFIVMLTGSLLSYFINYRQIVLTADQKDYKVTLNIQGFKIIKVLLQILAVSFLCNGYVYWLLLEFLMAFVTAIVLNVVLKKEYPWLLSKPSAGKILRRKYPDIIRKTKQLFFHKIAGFALSQLSTLIIYAYTSLTLVAIYGNYMLIVTGISFLFQAIFNSISAGVGNLVAEGEHNNIKRIYWELSSFRIWIVAIICFGIYELSNPFIVLWIGKEYLMDSSAFIALIVLSFLTLNRGNDSFLIAYGLFHDIWAPIVECILNIGCSVVLGYYWGMQGIFWGVSISLILVVHCWKPYFLYRTGFKERVSEYIIKQIKYLSILSVAAVIEIVFLDWIPRIIINSFYDWVIYASLVVSSFSVISLGLLYISDNSIRGFIGRLLPSKIGF